MEELAEKVARSVIKTGKTVTLEPMRPYERKIIHSKLQENNKIRKEDNLCQKKLNLAKMPEKRC